MFLQVLVSWRIRGVGRAGRTMINEILWLLLMVVGGVAVLSCITTLYLIIP